MAWIKAYKGFDKDMKCRDFQYEEGKEYELPEGEEAKLCESGFHACEAPIDCLGYYAPNNSVYHAVEMDGVSDERSDNDSKVCCKKIRIGARLSIRNLVEAQIEYVKAHTKREGNGHSKAIRSANSATGPRSANSATGDWSANSATGPRSANSATGDWSANSATGDWSANSATGYGSANVSTGCNCKNDGAAGTISIGWGKNNSCKGKIGAYLVLCERGEWDGFKYPLIGEPVLVKVDGEKIKADTWYKLENGEFVEVEK